jgi:tRNA threonylcarbamoyladenosine biosynthesis protein TsaB
VRPGGSAASRRLIADALELLAHAGLRIEALDGLAATVGPGAFTGLRTACAVTQGLAFALERPVLPLDSLMLVAEDALQQGQIDGELWVAMDARMQEVYAASYVLVDDQWHVREAPALYTLDALAARWQRLAPAAVAGSAIEAFGAALPCADLRCIPRQQDRGRALASLVRRRWPAAPRVDAARLLPLYLRDKVALTTDERARLVAGHAPA